ncbi:unnamed protein product [Allacma fusca]|uniref:O-acyltransferase WSD1 C-terminal domain-containing protein n=1 Tax=Allacma fusca TaxID=39272 RepID=A0A8J2NUR3_9HEXA|nr:unnamed protein product [Allacma fusca]
MDTENRGGLFKLGSFLQLLFTTYFALIVSWLGLQFTIKIPPIKAVIEILVCNFTLVILSPVIFSVIALNLAVRFFLSTFLLGSRYKLIDGIDAVWAPVYPATVPNFTSLYVLEGQCDLNKIRKKIQLVTRHPNYVRFNYRVTRKYGYYCWEDTSDKFDVKNHVKIMSGCEDFQRTYSESEIFDKIQYVYDDFFPGDNPQWEILVIPNYRYNSPKESGKSHYAILFRMHHSILDGVSAGMLLQYGLADYPVKVTVDPLKPLNVSPLMRILPYALLVVVGARSVIQSLLLKEENCFHGKKMTGPKHVGWSRPIDLKVLKQLKIATRTSTTAILVSSFGGSLRSLAIKKKLPVPNSIHAAATVAMLPYPNAFLQNRFTSAHVPMEIGLQTPGERLKSAFQHANNMARSPDILMNYHMMQLTGSFPAIIVNEAMKNLNSTMLLSNVPGPAEDVYLFGGDKLKDAVAWGPFKGVTALGMVLFSYGGKIRAAVVADNVALPEPGDLTTLLTGFEEEIVKLANSSGITSSCFSD